jgi:hypothetical protein
LDHTVIKVHVLPLQGALFTVPKTEVNRDRCVPPEVNGDSWMI